MNIFNFFFTISGELPFPCHCLCLPSFLLTVAELHPDAWYLEATEQNGLFLKCGYSNYFETELQRVLVGQTAGSLGDAESSL